MNNEQKNWLKKVIFIISWRSAVEHNGVWNGNELDENKKNNIREKMKRKVREIIERDYCKDASVSEEKHVANIREIQDFSKNELSHKFNIGTIQKFFNLACKYYWCNGWIKEPPHMPIDGLMLKKIQNATAWTKIETIKEYESLIEKLRETAKKEGLSLSQWELENWNSVTDKENGDKN